MSSVAGLIQFWVPSPEFKLVVFDDANEGIGGGAFAEESLFSWAFLLSGEFLAETPTEGLVSEFRDCCSGGDFEHFGRLVGFAEGFDFGMRGLQKFLVTSKVQF